MCRHVHGVQPRQGIRLVPRQLLRAVDLRTDREYSKWDSVELRSFHQYEMHGLVLHPPGDDQQEWPLDHRKRWQVQQVRSW